MANYPNGPSDFTQNQLCEPLTYATVNVGPEELLEEKTQT